MRWLFIILISVPVYSWSQGRIINIQDELIAYVSNPALFLKKDGFHISAYGRMDHNLSGIFQTGIAPSYQLSNHRLSINYSCSGSTLFLRSDIGLTYGLKIAGQNSIGINLGVQIQPNSEAQAKILPRLGIAAVLRISENWQMAFLANQLIPSKRGEAGSIAIPMSYYIGIRYKPKDDISLSFQISYHEFYLLSLLIDLSYQINPSFRLSGGLDTATRQPNLRLVLIQKDLSICLSLFYHYQLGLSPELAVQW